ncbi:MAG: TolC family protein [Acidobacteriota bacterium]
MLAGALALTPTRARPAADADLPEELKDVAVELGAAEKRPGEAPFRTIRLTEALDIALSDNTELALARVERQVACGRREAARGALMPSLRVGALAGSKDGRVQGSFGKLRDVEFDTFAGSVALVYEANLGARIHQAVAERKELEAATLSALSVEQRLLLRVAELYEELMLTSVGVEIAEQLIDGSRQFLGIVSAREGAGLGLGSDVARAEAKLASDRQQLVRARNLRDDASRRLALALRLDPRTPLRPFDARLEPTGFPSAAGDERSVPAVTARPDVEAARRRADAAANQARAARWDLWSPELRAEVGQVEIGDTVDDLEGRTDLRALLVWNFSLEKIGLVRQRRAEEEAARLRSVEAEDRARGEVVEVERELRAARESIPLAERELVAAARNLRLSEARFKAGTAIALEVLDAQDVLARARFNLARAITAYNTAQLRLLAATGTIDRGSFEPLDDRPMRSGAAQEKPPPP